MTVTAQAFKDNALAKASPDLVKAKHLLNDEQAFLNFIHFENAPSAIEFIDQLLASGNQDEYDSAVELLSKNESRAALYLYGYGFAACRPREAGYQSLPTLKPDDMIKVLQNMKQDTGRTHESFRDFVAFISKYRLQTFDGRQLANFYALPQVIPVIIYDVLAPAEPIMDFLRSANSEIRTAILSNHGTVIALSRRDFGSEIQNMMDYCGIDPAAPLV